MPERELPVAVNKVATSPWGHVMFGERYGRRGQSSGYGVLSGADGTSNVLGLRTVHLELKHFLALSSTCSFGQTTPQWCTISTIKEGPGL